MADNPIKYSEFIQPDDSVSNLIAQLEEVADKYAKLQKSLREEAAKTEAALKKVSGATEEGRDATKKAVTEAERLAKAQEELTKASSENTKELAALRAAKTKANQQTKLEAKLAEAAEGSYDKLSAQYSINKIKLNAMSKAQREGTNEGKALESQTKAIFEEMKRLQEATGKHTLSVGDYAKGWADVKGQLGQIPGATGEAASGLDGISSAMKALLANPLVLFISALVAGFALLFKLFSKTKVGADGLAKASAFLSGALSALTGVADKVGKGLSKAFQDPKQALADFWEALKTNVVNRFKGILLLNEALGQSLKALFSRDLKGLESAAKNAGTALVQMGFGLDAQQQKDFGAAVSGTTEAILKQAEAFAKLEEKRRETVRANRELEKSSEDLLTKEELLRATADDATKSFKDREDAAKAAAELAIKRANIDKDVASANLGLINREIDLRTAQGEDVEELLDKQLEGYKTLAAANRAALLTIRDDEKRASELKQDRLEKDLDILIDGFDVQKTLNERFIADESNSFEARAAKLAETRALFEETFSAQAGTIEKFTGVQLDANALVNESNAVALNQKIRGLGVSEIIEGRTLEIVKERKIGLIDLAEAERDLAKQKAEADAKALEDAKTKKDEEYKLALEGIEQRKDLTLTEIDILKATEAEKTKLRLQAEKDRLNKILALNKDGEGELSQIQIDAVKNTITKIDDELSKAAKTGEGKDLYEIVGLKLDDDGKQSIADSVGFAIGQVGNFLAANTEAAQASVAAAETEKGAAQSRLAAEIEARNNGYANNVDSAKKELELAKANQAKAEAEQRKAEKAQRAFETVQQVGSLVTASAKIWGTLGFPLALPAIAIMWGSFAASKAKAAQVAKTRQFKDGGLEFLQGGSHASGHDIPLGYNNDGAEMRAEGGEALAVVNRASTRKYRKVLPSIINALNKGVFEDKFTDKAYAVEGANVTNIGGSADLSRLEDGVYAIKKQGESKTYTDGKGRTVTKYKNLTTWRN